MARKAGSAVRQGHRDPSREAGGDRPGGGTRAVPCAQRPREGERGAGDGKREGLVELRQDQHRPREQGPQEAEPRRREGPAADGAGQARDRPGREHARHEDQHPPEDAGRPRVCGVFGPRAPGVRLRQSGERQNGRGEAGNVFAEADQAAIDEHRTRRMRGRVFRALAEGGQQLVMPGAGTRSDRRLRARWPRCNTTWPCGRPRARRSSRARRPLRTATRTSGRASPEDGSEPQEHAPRPGWGWPAPTPCPRGPGDPGWRRRPPARARSARRPARRAEATAIPADRGPGRAARERDPRTRRRGRRR
jgi:hypothetical protein